MSTTLAAVARRGFSYFADFGVSETLVLKTLAAALGHGADYADLFFQHRICHRLALEDGEVNRASIGVEVGVGVRVLKGEQTGYAYTEDLTKEAMTQAARTAAAVATGPCRPAPQSFHVSAGNASFYPLKTPWESVRTEQKLPLLTALNERAFKRDARIKKVTVNFANEACALFFIDSEGRVAFDEQPMTLLALSCVAEEGQKRETNGYNAAARDGIEFFSEDRLERIITQAVARTTILFQAEQPPAGEMPVVLAAGSSGILLHEAIGHGMEADFNRKGTSIYADKINKRIASPLVSVVDDGTQPHARGSINVDDEGNATQRTTLVDKGILATYLHDRISAAHYKTKATGSGRRESFRCPPLPRMRSTYMENGPHDKEEIIKSVRRGIYCHNFSNGQVQIGAGDFTFYVKNGYLIEDGKLTTPIKDVNVIGNGPKVLEQIDMVANDLTIDEGGWTCGKDGQSVPVSQGMPTVRVQSMTVGGRS